MTESPTALAISLARGPLIGTFLGLILYGVTCIQAFFYFRTYEHDSWRLKMTVAVLVVLETTHAAMSMWVIDDYLVAHYGNVQALTSATWSSTSTYTLGLLIDFYVYLYFTWRIWLFTRSIWIVVLMSALSISRTVISILATVFSVLKPTWSNYLTSYKALILAGNVLFIVGDTFSATTMAYHLTKFKSWSHELPRSRPRRIDVLLNRLLIFAVATGALTSLVDLIALVLTLSQPHSLAFLSAILVQTRLYANSLLASLNIRNATLRAYDNACSPLELPAISLRFARPSDLSSMSDADDAARGRVRDVNKSGADSWQTTHVQSRTSPQV
ncbi:hypothetical protein OG21DRAFT_1182638 [Imleria badia]|nr:hypothetical protein OG21DRAFT_1182638 [Imleria badia]